MDNADERSPFRVKNGAVSFFIKVITKAAHNKVAGFEPYASPNSNAGKYLKLYVTTVPEAGKANAKVVSLIASELNIAKQNVSIIRGHTSDRKTILIDGLSDSVRQDVCVKLLSLLTDHQ
jgi:uncharacterized protein YggU (UPF0235/DUF167 family)